MGIATIYQGKLKSMYWIGSIVFGVMSSHNRINRAFTDTLRVA